MAFTEKIRVLFDIDEKGAVGSFGKIKQSVNEADGAFGKAKAGAAGFADGMKANIGMAAVAAGTALVTFGVKAVTAFQDAALTAGKFGDATGLAVEDASRWIEVAGDLGIEAGAIEGSFLKLNMAIANGKPALEEYGVEVVKTKEGLVDSNATFQNAITTIGAIRDPTLRAKAAQELFGKSYKEVAELMEMSAGDLESALLGVSESKIIDEEEVGKARDFRAAMDELKDKFEEVQLMVGEAIVPVLTDLAGAIAKADGAARAFGLDGLGGVISVADKFLRPIGAARAAIEEFQERVDLSAESTVGLADEMDGGGSAAAGFREGIEDLDGSLVEVDRSARDFALGVKDANDELRAAETALRNADAALSALKGNVDQREAWRNLEQSLADLAVAVADPKSSWNDLSAATDKATKDMADYIAGAKDVPAEVKTSLYAQLDAGDLELVGTIIAQWAKGVTVPVKFVGQGNVGFMKNARGTPPGGSPGGLTLVGEEGPELVNMPKGAHVTPAGETARMLGGAGGPMVVNIYPRVMPTDRELSDLIAGARRRQGSGFV